MWTAEKIKSLRISLGLTQEQFAKRLRVGVGTIRHWEQGYGSPIGPAEVVFDYLEKELAGNAEPIPA